MKYLPTDSAIMTKQYENFIAPHTSMIFILLSQNLRFGECVMLTKLDNIYLQNDLRISCGLCYYIFYLKIILFTCQSDYFIYFICVIELFLGKFFITLKIIFSFLLKYFYVWSVNNFQYKITRNKTSQIFLNKPRQ